MHCRICSACLLTLVKIYRPKRLPKMAFRPGTINGVPVESTAALPIDFSSSGEYDETAATFQRPTVASSAEEILAIYRECYPDGMDSSAKVLYRIKMSRTGRASAPEVVESSGDERLDKAGMCIVTKLRFTPAGRNGVAVATTIPWTILVRPPPESP